MIFCILTPVSGVLAIAIAAAAAQQPTFQTTVRLVRLNISVIDQGRVPVRGLGRRDFTIRIDGVVQPIAEVVEIDTAANVAARAEGEAEGVTTNDRLERRAFVLILDDANTHNDAQMMADVKKAARTFVDGLTARDRHAEPNVAPRVRRDGAEQHAQEGHGKSQHRS